MRFPASLLWLTSSPLSLSSKETFQANLSLLTPLELQYSLPHSLTTNILYTHFIYVFNIWSPSPHTTKEYFQSLYLLVFTIYSLLYPQYLEDCLAHSICQMEKVHWLNWGQRWLWSSNTTSLTLTCSVTHLKCITEQVRVRVSTVH